MRLISRVPFRVGATQRIESCGQHGRLGEKAEYRWQAAIQSATSRAVSWANSMSFQIEPAVANPKTELTIMDPFGATADAAGLPSSGKDHPKICSMRAKTLEASSYAGIRVGSWM